MSSADSGSPRGEPHRAEAGVSPNDGWTVQELGRLLQARELSALEVTEHYLARIEQLDDRVGAFCFVQSDQARAAARAADRELSRGVSRGPLHGVPVAVKDLIFVAGMPITGGSLVYRDLVAEQDDVAIARLREAGMVILGKTNTAEFGFSATQTANGVNGETRNPWNLDRSPGGSSGGSAAAVAAGLAPVAIGSDGGGSIRIPSSFCGVTGLKPTFGRIPMYPGCRDPRWPGLSAWESVEHLGPIARATFDAALLLDEMAGPDSRDRHSLPRPPGSFADALSGHEPGSLAGVRVGWSPDWGGSLPVDSEVRESVVAVAERLEGLGGSVESVHPAPADALEAFGVTVAVDADPRAVRALLDGQPDRINPRIAGIIGQEWSFLDVADALRRRRELYISLAALFADYDVLLTPTVPTTALALGVQGPEQIDGHFVDERDRPRAIIEFTYPFNLTGHPGISVPCGLDRNGLPIGVQLVSDRLREDAVLRVARAIEAFHPPALAPEFR